MTLYTACETIITEDDLACDCDVAQIWGGLDPVDQAANLAALLDAACDALANVSGYPVGRCTKVYRPCRSRCHYFNCPCGCNVSGIRLKGLDPEVTAVTIDGATLATTEYMVLELNGYRWLERINPDTGYGDSWPSWQNLRAPASAAHTFSVSVEAGTRADQIAKNAAAEIACDILHYLTSERESAPDGVIAAQAYGAQMSWKQFSAPTELETMRIAGFSWVQRFIATRGGSHPIGISSPGVDHAWTLYERVA